MDSESHVTYVMRLLLCFNNYLASQFHPDLQLQIDSDTWLRSITFLQDGQRVRLVPWALAPGGRPKDAEEPTALVEPYDGELISQEPIRKATWDRIQKFKAEKALCFPTEVKRQGGLGNQCLYMKPR
jgi:hypothetical protein